MRGTGRPTVRSVVESGAPHAPPRRRAPVYPHWPKTRECMLHGVHRPLLRPGCAAARASTSAASGGVNAIRAVHRGCVPPPHHRCVPAFAFKRALLPPTWHGARRQHSARSTPRWPLTRRRRATLTGSLQPLTSQVSDAVGGAAGGGGGGAARRLPAVAAARHGRPRRRLWCLRRRRLIIILIIYMYAGAEVGISSRRRRAAGR